jgi:hypothetical protein
MKTIQAFQTSDGRIFETEMAASQYEYQISVKRGMEDFFNSPYWGFTNKNYKTQALRFITKWEEWKAAHHEGKQDGTDS